MKVAACVVLVSSIGPSSALADPNCPYRDGGTIVRSVPLGCPLEIYYPVETSIEAPSTVTVTRNGQPVELAVTSSMPLPALSLLVNQERPEPMTCESEWFKEPHDFTGISLEIDGLEVGDAFSTTIIGMGGFPCPGPEAPFPSGFEQWLYCQSPGDAFTECCATLGMEPDCYEPFYANDSGGPCNGCSSSSSASLGTALVLLLRKRKRRSQ